MSVGFMKNGTFIECSTIEELHAEEEARIAGDAQLQSNIDAEAEAREAADTAEAEARKDADDQLQAAIDAEAEARKDVDGQLQDNIDAEVEARIAADKALQALIETEASQRQAADIALQSNIDAEAVTRAAADTALQGSLDSEATSRAAADSALQAAVDSMSSTIGALAQSLETIAGAATGGYLIGSVNEVSIKISEVSYSQFTLASGSGPFGYAYVWTTSYSPSSSDAICVLVDNLSTVQNAYLAMQSNGGILQAGMQNNYKVVYWVLYSNWSSLPTIMTSVLETLSVKVVELIPVSA